MPRGRFAGILIVIFKILEKGRFQKNSEENPIVHNLFITFDLSKIFRNNSQVIKLVVLEP